MSQFIEGSNHQQAMLLPEYLDDDVDGNGPVRAIYAFSDFLDLPALGFNTRPANTVRPGDHPGLMLLLSSWIPEPDPVVEAVGTGVRTQSKAHLADRSIEARLQDDRGRPQG